MTINPVIPYDSTESGINSGFNMTANVDGINLDIAEGEFRFSDYNGTRPRILRRNAISFQPGLELGTYPDLNTVEPSWPAIQGDETFFFFVVARDGNMYQTIQSPLIGSIIRNYLTLGAVSIDNIVDRNIATIFNFKNINSKDYELSNVLGPQIANNRSLLLNGKSDMTISRSAGSAYFSGINFNVDALSPSVKDYPAEDPTLFQVVHRRNDGSFYTTPLLSDLSPYEGLYDDGTAGPTSVLPTGNLNNSNWTIHYIFFEASLGINFLLVGQTEYNNLNRLQEGLDRGTEKVVIPPFLNGVQNRSYLFMRGNANSLDPADGRAYIKTFNERFFNRDP